MGKQHNVKKLTVMNIVAILAIFLFSGAGSFMNAAVQTMMDAWPQMSATMVRLVTSLPSLVSLPITIAIGSVAGKKLSYRFCAIVGTAMILAAGIAPFFFYQNWMIILMFRAVVGVGVGLVAMRNSLILKSVPEELQAAVTGYGSALMNAGGMLAGPIVGAMAAFGWRVPFLFDLLALIPLIIMLIWLKEPEKALGEELEHNKQQIQEKGVKQNEKVREKLDWRVIYYIIIQFLQTAFLYPLLSGMSTYLAAKGFGSAFMAGISNAIYCGAGVLINIVLSPIEKKLGKNLIPVMCLIFSIGMATVTFAPGMTVILVGAALCGISFNTMMSIFQLYNGKAASPKMMALTSTILIASLSLGNFMSVYFINFSHMIFHRGSDAESTYFASMLVYFIFAVTAFVFKVAPKEYYHKEGNGFL